ncbi:MAG: hypothetical protein POELPBGB_00929 [Bacteroidia bacterium]|nr:hypothetical protein [Bacteroidia bacterium]
MQNSKIRLVFFTASLIIYNYLFWGQSSGINLPLFSFLLGITAVIINPESLHSRRVQATASGTFITGVLVVIHHSNLSVFAHVISFYAMLGFIQQNKIKSLYNAFLQSVSGLLVAPKRLLVAVTRKAQANSKTAKAFRLLSLVLLPMIVFIIFYFIYTVANPLFEELTLSITTKINDLFQFVFRHLSIEWVIFIGFGSALTAVVVFRTISQRWLNNDAAENETLLRRKSSTENFIGLRKTFSNLALKNERRSGIIFLVLINLLLLVVNIIDINWIWFDFVVPQKFNLKQFVHEGTYMLIFSILLSMAILLYLFRNNQNFLKENRLLKTLAYLWIAQNAVLCYSVFLRNFHYINYHGLAYKRIGVIVFLLLTFAGLITLFIKIKEVKSGYFLLRKNTWFAYSVMVVLCLFNWDLIIVRYNLNHWNSDDIDVSFYRSLSDRALPELFANREKVQRQMELHKINPERWLSELDYGSFENYLTDRKEHFMFEQKLKQWQSWNYADAKTYKALQEIKEPMGYLEK